MESGFRLDHLVILVKDLARAQEDYRALGFTVVPGGRHEALGTQNALIALSDASYLELIAFDAPPAPETATAEPGSPSPARERFRRWGAAGEGLVDFALLPLDIEEAVQAAEDRGLHYLGPLPGGRRRPDGVQVAWQFAFPDAPGLPFLCADVTPRALRVPEGPARVHKNGASGILEVRVLVRDLEESTLRYSRLLGRMRRCVRPAIPEGGEGVQFHLPATTLTLVQPAEGTGLGACLGSRGEGPYEGRLSTARASGAGRLEGSLLHGARLELQA